MSSEVKNMISQVVGYDVLARHYTIYDGFVIRNPSDCRCTLGGTVRSEKNAGRTYRIYK